MKVDHLELKVNEILYKREYLKMTNVSHYCNYRNNDERSWQSNDFCSSHRVEGYNMYMSVSFSNEGESCKYLSCYIYFTKGRYDDTLEWPFQGEITIELLNQLEDENYHRHSYFWQGI